MFKRFYKLLSAVLVFVLLLQMLPLQTFAINYRSGLSDKIVLPNISATDKVTVAPEEITAKRTAYSKEYRMADGQNMAVVYPVDIHYQTENGWEEIDNSLKLTGGNFINTAGPWQVALPQQLSKDGRISITKDGYTLRFGMAGQLRLDDSVAVMSANSEPSTKVESMGISQAQVSPKKLLAENTPAHVALLSQKNHSRLSYGNVYQNTNVIYDLQGSRVKESIVLASYDSDLVGYRYILETGKLNPELKEDGSIHFYDAEKENMVMLMEAPFLIDNAGEQTNDVRVTLTGKEGTYYLTYSLPRQWLAAEERAWPVILDPQVAPCIRYYNIQDKTVGDVITNSWNWAISEVGYYAPRGVERVYLKFNELPVLTSADVITHAEIQMHKPLTSSQSAPIEVHKVLTTWEEYDMTWANKPAISNTVEDYNIVQNAGNYTWVITDIARGWYAGENTGMLFKATDEIEQARETNWKQFHSSDMGDDSVILTIHYRNNNGLESYWDYSSFSAGRAGTGYVNNFTGNLVWTRADLGFGGTRAAVAISHIYNANDTADNLFGMGYGWRTNYNQRVYWVGGLGNYYAWEDGDGTEHYFYQEDGVYKDEDSMGLTLTTTGSGTSKYTITDKAGNVSCFDTKGRLTQISNNQATKSPVTITYTNTSDNSIYTITDAVGRRYVFTYEDDLLTKIEAQSRTGQHLTQVTYGYTNGLLTSITDKDEESVAYTYSGEKLLTEAEDIDGYRLAISYNTTAEGAVRRVATVSEFDGNTEGGTLTFTYAQNQTTIEDYSGNQTTYQFNNWGNTISIQDGEGRAQFAEYATDTDENGKGNQLTAASKLQNTVSNLFTDSSFEGGTLWQPYEGYDAGTITTTQAYHGNKSVQLLSSSDGADMDSPSFTVRPGETYTFSAYIKLVSGEAEMGFDGPAYTTIWIDPENEWQRVQVSYTNNTQQEQTFCSFVCVTGEAYVDCVQLEKSPTASRYNLVENGDFNANSGWTGAGLATGDGISATQNSASWLSAKAYKITGDPEAAKSVSQQVAVSGGEGDTFVLAGWAQGDGVPFENGSDQRDRTFGLKAVFHYTDGTNSDPMTVSFNPDTPYWQYAAVPLVAEKAYNSITVTLQYDYGMNTIYFDGIGLYKEQFSSSYTYDADGDVTSVTDLQERTTTYEYQGGDLTREILPDNTSMTYTYDIYHNVLTATSSTGLVYTFTYDTYGNNTSVSISDGDRKISSTATYTTNGNALSFTTDNTGHTTTYYYTEDTNVLEWMYYPEDDLSTRESYVYDEMYRVTDSFKGSRENAWVQYEYTDDLLTEIVKTGASYTLRYGAFDLQSSVQVGSKILATYEYENRTNRLLELEYGNQDHIRYTYDTQGRVTKDTYEDGDTVSYLYDNSGSLATVIDSGSGITTTYYYDFIDRLAKYAESGTNYSHSVEYGYDTKNNLSTLEETINGALRTTEYSYDDDNRLETVTANGNTVEYTYDDFGRIVTKTVLNDAGTVMTTTYTYRNRSATTTSTQVESIQHTAGNYSVTYTYTYDGNGNILSINDGTNTITYEYDARNQLTRENDPIAGITREFSYKDGGQLDIECRAAYTEQPINWAQSSLVSYTSDREWGDMLVAFDGRSITCDEIGNMLSDGTYAYTWEHGRELATMADNTGTWTFTYDANGMRTKRVRTNTYGTVTDTYTYVYNGSQLSQMTKNGQVLNFFYDGEGRPSYFTYNNATYYYVTNLQGDVVAILDSTGAVMVNYHYDAYGDLMVIEDIGVSMLSWLNPLRYRGYVYDNETGLYYLQSRYYNPTIRQFISPDAFVSTGQGYLGYNMFAYCNNNPVNFKDPTGEIAVTTVLLIVAGVAAVAAGTYTAYATYEEAGQVDWGTTTLVTASTFVTIYSCSMYLYSLYGSFCAYYGYTAITNIGSPQTPPASTSANVNANTNMQHIADKGFDTFRQLKNEIGSAGAGNEWHHIVEQSQIAKSGFAPQAIQNTQNIVAIEKATHHAISGYYSSIQPFTNGMTVRNWLAGQSYDVQYAFGLDVIKIFE